MSDDFDSAWAKAKSEPAPVKGADFDSAWKAAKKEPPPPPKPKVEGPSTASAALHGAVQGGTLGFADEFAGFFGAALRKDPAFSAMIGMPTPEEMGEENIFTPTGYGLDFGDAYRRERDAARAEDDANKAAHPVAYGAAEIGGTLAVPLPGAGVLKGPARAVAYGTQGAALGGSSALGHSREDLTKGDPAALDRVNRDMGVSATIGAPSMLLGGLLGDKIAKMGAAARSSSELANQKTLEGAVSSMRGSYGGEVSSASRTLELLEKAASDPTLPEDMSRNAADFLAGPEGQALRQQVIRSALGQAPDKLARVQKARDALTDAISNNTPENVAKMTESDLAPSAAVKAIASRLKTLGERAIPPAIGGALGGPGGAIAGTLFGSSLGRPTTVVGNMMKAAPVVYNAAKALEPGARAAGKLASSNASTLAPYFDLLHDEDPSR